jgi:hypothetical protein
MGGLLGFSRRNSLLGLPLVQESDNTFTRLGQITLTGSTFEFGGSAMSWDSVNERLYMAGLVTAQTLGRLILPASVGDSATTSATPVTITGSIGESAGQVKLTGSLVYGGELYVNKSIQYDASAEQTGWIKKMNLDMGSQGSICSMSADNGAYVRRLSGAMGHIPSEWQSMLGGPAFTTGCRLDIVSAANMGYGFAVFDPADVPSGGGSVPVVAMLDYYGATNGTWATMAPRSLEPLSTHDDYAAYPKNANGGLDFYSETNAFVGTAFIHPGSRSLLFITCHGYGVADNGCRVGSSVHNDPNRIQVVAYDLQDIVDVKNGVQDEWAVEPYDWWELPDWDVPWTSCVGSPSGGAYPGNFCWIPDRNWVIGLADGTGLGTNPIQVWSVASL